jgi:hypothetical protein
MERSERSRLRLPDGKGMGPGLHLLTRMAPLLPGMGSSQKAAIGRFAGDELGVGRIGDVDRQPQFGSAGQILVEAREGGDAAVEDLGALVSAIVVSRQP